ncbi:MAG: SIMPL domain-containing protein [Patescibacteria group bacterium]
MEDKTESKCEWVRDMCGHGLVAKMLAIFLIIVSIFYIVKIKNEYRGYNRTQPATTISVSGEGKEFIKPDIATISVGVIKQNVDLLKAQKEAADVIDKVLAVLKDKGVADKDQKTTSFNIYPQYDYRDGVQKFRAYEVRQTLEVKIRDLSKVGEILGGVAGAGANEVGSLNFTVDNPKAMQEKARAAAIEEAKTKAKTLSRDLGVRLVKIASYSESGGAQPPPIFYEKAMYGMGVGGGSDVSIPTGENEVRINVTITYEIK